MYGKFQFRISLFADSLFRSAAPNTPKSKGRFKLNKNPKEKTARIELRAKAIEKEQIQRLAARCHLPVSEYVIKRALGYEPKAVPPDAFFDFYDKLCQIINSTEDAKTEAVLLELADEMHTAFLLPGKDSDVKWQPPDSGPSKAD